MDGTRTWWMKDVSPLPAPRLEHDERCDVAIVGAGVAGLTAAYLLARQGLDVRVLDRHGPAQGESGRTTAHLAYVVDTPPEVLIRNHGEDGARKVWQAGIEAISLIRRICESERIDAHLEDVDGVLFGGEEGDEKRVREWSRHADRLGFASEEVDPAELPVPANAAVRFRGNARFHPLRYLKGLAERAQGHGATLHGASNVTGTETTPGDRQRVVVDTGASLTARHVLITSNVPFVDRVRMWTKLYQYRTYVVAARVPKGSVPDLLLWEVIRSPGEPYLYVRLEPGPTEDVLIVGGRDHKVGQEADPRDRWEALVKAARAIVPGAEVVDRWSGQIIENLDDIPYVGRNPGGPANERIATAFSGNGMTLGTLAGWMLAEQVQGRTTAWDELFDPSRKSPSRAKEYVQENVDFAKGLAHRLVPPAGARDLAVGEGAVFARGGRKVAVCRDKAGVTHAVSAICTHLKCEVSWNRAEGSWDCGCHGSRFAPDGRVLNGPARSGLESLDDEETPSREEEATTRRR